MCFSRCALAFDLLGVCVGLVLRSVFFLLGVHTAFVVLCSGRMGGPTKAEAPGLR